VVERFKEFLAEDFVIQIEGTTSDRDEYPEYPEYIEYIEYIATPRPFHGLAGHDVDIRILSDVALIHARVTLTALENGVARKALYTDPYHKREGTRVCVAACAPDPVAIA
jgi:hypothetical protein